MTMNIRRQFYCRRAVVGAVLAAILTLFVGFASAQTGEKSASAKFSGFTLERSSDNGLYIRRGAARFLLGGSVQKLSPRTGGWDLLLTPKPDDAERSARILHHGKIITSLSLKKLESDWLSDDAKWSDHAAANQMRYMNSGAGGVQVYFDEAFPTDLGWVGVLTWHSLGPSGEPTTAQHLVFVPAAQNGEIKEVRPLVMDNPFGLQTRLISFTNKAGGPTTLLLWEPGKLTSLGPQGEARGIFMTLPDAIRPAAQINSRWLILSDSNRLNQIAVADLQRKTERTLLELSPYKTGTGYRTLDLMDFDETTSSLLVHTEESPDYKDKQENLLLLSVPGGEKRELPKGLLHKTIAMWRGHLFVQDTDKNGADFYTVYDIRTTKAVQRLSEPPVLPATPKP